MAYQVNAAGGIDYGFSLDRPALPKDANGQQANKSDRMLSTLDAS